ncbi:MAG: heme ABC transporter permease [Candidatus Parabeggiatoa sp. nov. 3]|nr:MAG: heme ABC transporter permease [Gammaproteobacteria bacterium]RKZ62373.1 MAG: heme ABC transporter permease [Gammaproteobacteria bacterium]RKZ89962.1 MAG: heme ABC transporter permease [Gammaproteobacteria bacterium]HEW97738.1 heme ABC transporter permease [Beggiatoa sp.]
MWAFFQKLSSPKYFYTLSGRLIPWFGWTCFVLMLVGLYYSLFFSPPDYQQKDSVRIMYVHVPAAWMSMFVYMVMATAAGIGLVWRIKLAEMIAASSAPIGASFTFLALATGSLWGKPMWGTWWVWDARLTSELILLFLYLGVIALNSAIEDKRTAARASGVLALVGVVNIPIIHYSVEWWNTLHQGSTVTQMITKFEAPTIHLSMLIPLLLMALAFKLFYATAVLMRARCEILERERNTRWVEDITTRIV